ncbi:MAG TPA: Ig-like domain repeat protein [Propionicimonas sp.]|nr:Ig-like domain repeat protein [Propionicimonas sp.]
MKANKLALSVLTGALACTVAFGVAPAYADPSGTPTYRPLVGVGSDTTQSVMNGMADAIKDGSGNKILGSYDAVNPTTGLPGDLIQTRADGLPFTRPNGSGSGQKALTSSIKGLTYPAANGVDITGQLDYSRSSSGPSAAGTDLTFIPFAKDALSYAYSNTDSAAAVPSDLTVAQLTAIFDGTTTSYTGTDGLSHNYVPLLPQTGSGSRSFFLKTLGLSETQVAWITTTFQENEGTTIDAVGEIAPFSVAAYIAQTNGVVTNTVGANKVILGKIAGSDPILGDGTLNTAFSVTRNVYNVVSTDRLSGTSDADKLLQSTFVGETSAVCSQVAVIHEYGFGDLGSGCGTTTQKAGFVVDGSTPMLTATAAPRINGSAKVGSTLTAFAGTWTGTVTKPTFSYRWMRNGATITGATAASYKLTAADAGTSISVAIVANAGSVSASATTAKVAVAKISSSVKASFDKNAKKHAKKGKVKITVTASGVTAPTGTVNVYDGKKKVGSAKVTTSKKGIVTVKLTKKLSKGKHKMKITYSGSTGVASSSRTLTLKVK